MHIFGLGGEPCVWFVWNVVCVSAVRVFGLGASECLYVFCPLFCVVFAVD